MNEDRDTIKVSATIPREIVEKLDKERGLVTRSKYMVFLLEKALGITK